MAEGLETPVNGRWERKARYGVQVFLCAFWAGNVDSASESKDVPGIQNGSPSRREEL